MKHEQSKADLLEGLAPSAIKAALRKEPGPLDDVFDISHTKLPTPATTLLAASLFAFLLCMQIRTPFALIGASIAIGAAGYACLKLYIGASHSEATATRAELMSLQRKNQQS